MKHLIWIILVIFIACDKNEESQAEKDDRIIREYLANHDIEAEKHSSGLYYLISEEGTGSHPTANSVVTVKYVGYLTNGDVFDSTQGSNTATFSLSSLIQGWRIGIPLLKPGGKGTFYIPSELGYGDRNVGSIPANSVLIFDIDLIEFE
jgi:FKBP-type peptidyl-prolyl cis-trans isomerase